MPGATCTCTGCPHSRCAARTALLLGLPPPCPTRPPLPAGSHPGRAPRHGKCCCPPKPCSLPAPRHCWAPRCTAGGRGAGGQPCLGRPASSRGWASTSPGPASPPPAPRRDSPSPGAEPGPPPSSRTPELRLTAPTPPSNKQPPPPVGGRGAPAPDLLRAGPAGGTAGAVPVPVAKRESERRRGRPGGAALCCERRAEQPEPPGAAPRPAAGGDPGSRPRCRRLPPHPPPSR